MTSMGISQLNDDCLRHIISFLPLAEKIKAAFVCKRFAEVASSIPAKKVYVGDLNTISEEEAEVFFSTKGASIQSLTISEEDVLAPLALEHCSNLETLNMLLGNNKNQKPHFKLQRIANTLRELYIYRGINSYISPQIGNFEGLETLHLTSCWLEECDLTNLNKLTELSMIDSCMCKLSFLEGLFQSQKNLKKLRFLPNLYINDWSGFVFPTEVKQSLEWLDTEEFYFQMLHPEEMVNLKHIKIRGGIESLNIYLAELTYDHSEKIETVVFHSYKYLQIDDTLCAILPVFTNLTTLVMGGNLTPDLLRQLTLNLNHLKRFHLVNTLVTYENLVDIVQNLRHLEFLAIPDYEPLFTLATYYDVVEIRKMADNKVPLTICICYTLMDFQDTQEYKEREKFVKTTGNYIHREGFFRWRDIIVRGKPRPRPLFV